MDSIRRDLSGFLLLAAVSLGAGLLLNYSRPQPLALVYASKAERLDQAVTKVAAAAPAAVSDPSAGASLVASAPATEVREIGLEEFRQLAAVPQAVILDARPEIFHRLGHIPGALALPRDDFEAYYPKHRELLEAHKNQLLLIYCNGTSCEDSHLVANALTKLGYTNLAIFTGGWSDWTQQRLPEERL